MVQKSGVHQFTVVQYPPFLHRMDSWKTSFLADGAILVSGRVSDWKTSFLADGAILVSGRVSVWNIQVLTSNTKKS